MPDPDAIGDDEVILRHVPGDKDHLAEGPRVTSANFEHRPGEAGVSVTRQGITPAAALMARIGDPAADSRIAAAVVGEIRSLGLDVVPRPIPEDPGYAEIVPASATLASRPIRRRLAKLFRLIDHDA